MYADDLVLLAPSRSAMKSMLRRCEEFADLHNLKFSTDPEPVKDKVYLHVRPWGSYVPCPNGFGPMEELSMAD